MPVCPINWSLINSSGTTSDLTPILAVACLGLLSNRVRATAQGALDIILFFPASYENSDV